MIAPTLTTDRLTIRASVLGDFEAYAAAWADPAVTRYVGGEPRDRTASWARFLQGVGIWSVLGYGNWTFEETDTGRFVGSGGIFRFERGVEALEGYTEAGWALTPQAWGKGYATEAMAAIIAWSDAHLGAPEFRAIIDHDNAASQRVAAKLGFAPFLHVIPQFPESALWRRTSVGA
jgi:RimJ/RimL family protein N-acetyltransferase